MLRAAYDADHMTGTLIHRRPFFTDI